MYMSRQRSGKSIRSYNRKCSTSYKNASLFTSSLFLAGKVESDGPFNALVPSTTTSIRPNSTVYKPQCLPSSSTTTSSTHMRNQTDNTLFQFNPKTGNSFRRFGLFRWQTNMLRPCSLRKMKLVAMSLILLHCTRDWLEIANTKLIHELHLVYSTRQNIYQIHLLKPMGTISSLYSFGHKDHGHKE